MAGVGSFAQYGTVHEASVVKIDDDLPLSRACLLGCGVDDRLGFGRQHRRRLPRRHRRGDRLRRYRQSAPSRARGLRVPREIVVVDLVETKRDKAFEFGPPTS